MQPFSTRAENPPIKSTLTSFAASSSIFAPNPVEGLTVNPIDSGVVLEWAGVKSANRYIVYQDGVEIGDTASTQYTIEGLVNGVDHTFGVVARNASGVSTMVTQVGHAVEGATYDTFINGLNTALEQKIGDETLSTMFQGGCTYIDSANNERLKAKLAKMQNGEATKVAFMGGSITVGETATQRDENNHAKGYAYYTYQWLKKNFDVQNKSKFINGSISGTGTEIGIVRAQKDILNHNPDIIFIEFAGNNGTSNFYKQTFESLVRKCLKLESNPAIVLVFSATTYSGGAENYMSTIGAHYQLPMFTMDKAFKAFCEKDKYGNISKSDPIFAAFSNDGTHPNDEGHQLYAKLLAKFLKELYKKSTDTAIPAIPAVSAAGYDKYEDLVSVDNTNGSSIITDYGSFAATNTATPSTSKQSDVTAFQQGWKKTSTTENDAMEISVNAKNFIVIYEAGNPKVANDPTGKIVVSYVNQADPSDHGELVWDLDRTCQQKNNNNLADITYQEDKYGWQNPVGILIFDKENAANYSISISTQDVTGICTIMAFGYTA